MIWVSLQKPYNNFHTVYLYRFVEKIVPLPRLFKHKYSLAKIIHIFRLKGIKNYSTTLR